MHRQFRLTVRLRQAQLLIACIKERAKRLEEPADLPVPRDRETLAQVLVSFGTTLVREISDPAVIAVFQLAIAEAGQAPEVARALDSIGREASRTALRKIMAQAEASGLVNLDLLCVEDRDAVVKGFPNRHRVAP
jgi:hypothetical protein